MSPPPTEMTCPRCSTLGSGRFCTECGAPLSNAPCPGCSEPLTPGAKFCHRCGSSTTISPQSTPGKSATTMATTLPWAVAAIAFLALFAMLAGKGLNAKRGSSVDAPQNALPNPALDGSQTAEGASGDGSANQTAPFANGMNGGAVVRAPNISNLTPSEIAEKLFNKIMLLNTQGKSDSVQFFAPMAIQAYQMLEQQQGHPFDADQRYDLGRIAEVAGAIPFAKAQADTILQRQPDHLLGLILSAHVAKLSGNTTSLQEYSRHFARVKRAELTKDLPEYRSHRADIDGGI